MNSIEDIRFEPKRDPARLIIGPIIADHARSIFIKWFASTLNLTISANPVKYWFNECLPYRIIIQYLNKELTFTNIRQLWIAMSRAQTDRSGTIIFWIFFHNTSTSLPWRQTISILHITPIVWICLFRTCIRQSLNRRINSSTHYW